MMLEDESSCFPPKRMRRICGLLDIEDLERSRQLREDLLGIRRAHLLGKEEQTSVKPSQIRRELRSGVTIVGAAARWVEILSGATQQVLEEAILSKADSMGAQWSRELPGLRRKRRRPTRKRIIDYHRDILEGLPWLLTNIKHCEIELELARYADFRNSTIASLMILFEEYTGKTAGSDIIWDSEGYRGATLALVIEVLNEIDPQHGLSPDALGARVRRIADARSTGLEKLAPSP
jgi:hypothetical protein